MNPLSSLSAARFCSTALALGLFGSALPIVQAAVSQSPLIIGSDIPGSLALVPSVEWPTVLSVANIGNYVASTRYSGYFDSEKCYLYQYGAQDVDRYFYPVATTSSASNFRCTGDKQWSGNFLNWAVTPTIDPFRSALTGGNRIVDSTTSTILQKARHSGQNSAGNRINTGQNMAQLTGALPLNNWANLNIRLQGLNFDMLISNWSDKIGGGGSSGEGQAEWVDYDPENSAQWSAGKLNNAYTPRGQTVKSVYRLKVQVKVCVSEALKEANCKLYPNGQYKPEGLLQQYSDRLRYSAFSYLNDGDPLRDGGVLRANQAYIGPNPPDQATNRAEWSPTTGILFTNPSPAEASATSLKIDSSNRIINSGIINYINKFGSMPYSGSTYKNLKDYDPVSELYYTAIRYFKNQGNVAAYSELSGDSDSRYAQADGFPVVNNWNDPITYSCQKNVILGIGDVNTWNDKNLPGNTVRDSEPDVPPEVKADNSDGDKADANKRVGVSKWTAKVAALEGITINTPFTGRGNSAYIAGLAYDAHVRDQRGDLPGKQTISTYWVDVRENQQLTAKASNQYWLATKYGGFTVPQDFDPDKATSSSITESMWTTNGQTLSTGDKRPDNFFVGGDADAMVSGLKNAFSKIVQETSTTSTSLGSNSTELETGSALFRSSFEPKYWSGDLQSLSINSSGVASNIATWSAAAQLDNASPDGRTILTSNALTSSTRALDTNVTYSSGGKSFKWSVLDSDAKTALRQTADGTTLVSDAEGEARLNYLRGDRSYETRSSNPMRTRKSRLGDIVNSDPYYAGPMDFGYNLLSGASWGQAGPGYLTFRQTIKDNKPFVVVGANDGMLHAFDTSTSGGGNELFAFVPRTLLGQLYRLTQRDYSHRYYVDGGITVGHAWVDSAWKTLAVGTAGAGGNSVFALDVTDPSAPSVKWEFSSSQMNYPIQRPSLVALENGKFGVIVTSGFVNGTATSGKVWILDAANGSVMASFTVNTSGGLGEAVAVDLTNDRIADRLYVPDTNGNIWRFDLKGADPANWGIPSTLGSSPLFTARAGNTTTDAVQPITSALSVTLNKYGNPVVLFGTGSYYQTGDSDVPASPRLESYYGLIDKGVTIQRSALVQQTFIAQQSSGTRTLRVVSSNDIPSDKSGWYLDLAFNNNRQGERVIARSKLRNGSLTFTSLIPSPDACKGGGISALMIVDAQTGSRLTYSPLDFNGDGVINDQDYYLAADGTKIPYSGLIDTQQGIVKTPTYINRGDSADTDLICYTGSATGQPQCEPVNKGSRVSERASWREIR